MHRDPSEWQIFENTHEAIIDQETYDIVQRIRDGRRRVTPMGEMPTLSGMVFCADCGAKLYQVRGRNLPQSEYMVCATYRKRGKEVCSSHQIRNSVIEEFLLDGIRNVATRLQSGDIFFCDCCTDCIREFGMYRWDEKAQMDRPIKENDHSMDDVRYFVHRVYAPDLISFK